MVMLRRGFTWRGVIGALLTTKKWRDWDVYFTL